MSKVVNTLWKCPTRELIKEMGELQEYLGKNEVHQYMVGRLEYKASLDEFWLRSNVDVLTAIEAVVPIDYLHLL